MVEKNKELVVLFRRKWLDDMTEMFVPFRVVEGTFDFYDGWFIDKNGYAYHHLLAPYTSGIAYGGRLFFSQLNIQNKKDLKEMKKKILNEYRKLILIKTLDEPTIITCYSENQDAYPFEDKDTEFILNREIDKFNYFDKEYEQSKNNKAVINLNPVEIANEVKKVIVGQDEAIKKIVTALAMNFKYPDLKTIKMLVIGPTGVGKTAIFEELSRILKVPLTIISMPGFSQAGYVGRGTEEILKQIIVNSGYDIELANRSIVILDEIDKLANSGKDSGKVSTEGVQNELLKIIDGDVRTISIGNGTSCQEYTIDTSHITFAGLGAFQDIYNSKATPKKGIGFNQELQIIDTKKINNDDIAAKGIREELIGRLPLLVELRSLNREDFIDILSTETGELKKYIHHINEFGVEIEGLDFLYDLIADDAINKKIGARGILSTITNIFMEIYYELLSNPGKYNKLIIGENILKDGTDYVLEEKHEKVKRLINSRGMN